MSLLNDASLVFIPSGYKEDKVYSVIPSNGAGDLDFVRGCDATRINPQALVENTPWNLINYSEVFNNSYWSKTSGTTVTADNTIAPNGTMTADKISFSAYGHELFNPVQYGVTGVFTHTFYAKGTPGQIFNFYDGVGDTAIILTSDWVRYTITRTYANQTLIMNFNSYGTWSASNFYLWGAQVNIGSIAKPYFPTTDRLNVPRLTYSPTLIERQSTNLLVWSEEFTSARGWTASNAGGSTSVVTANYGVAPNGTTTADRIQLDLNGGPYADWLIGQNILTVGQTYTYSIYLKSLTTNCSLYFLGGVGSNILKSITTDWVRYDYTFVASGTALYPRFLLESGSSSSVDILAWGFQLETGSLTSYIRTTSTSVTRVASYNSGCPSLLLEKQSTNLEIYSEQIDNAAYTKATYGTGAYQITPNYGISPDGTQNADRIEIIKGTGGVEIFQRATLSLGATYTLSFWGKSLSGTPSLYTNWCNGYSNLVTFTNEWVRYNISFTAIGVSGGFNLLSYITMPETSNTADILIWGVQLEAGSYPTSYIPTTNATVTRLTDSYSKTGVSSLIGQTQGTIFADFNITGLESIYGTAISVNDGVVNNYIWLTIFANGNLRAELWNGSVQASITYSGGVVGGRYKMAFGYNTNDFVLYVNGTQAGTDNSGTTFSGTTLSRIDNNLAGVAPNNVSQSTNELLLFKRRLTNTELANLTTL